MREQLEAQVEALAAQMRALDDENARLRVRLPSAMSLHACDALYAQLVILQICSAPPACWRQQPRAELWLEAGATHTLTNCH